MWMWIKEIVAGIKSSAIKPCGAQDLEAQLVRVLTEFANQKLDIQEAGAAYKLQSNGLPVSCNHPTKLGRKLTSGIRNKNRDVSRIIGGVNGTLSRLKDASPL